MTTIIDVADLPAPNAIEALDFDAILARQKAKFQEFWEAARASNPDIDLPPYDVAMLEFDPVIIDIEAESYRELLLRARVNDALRAVLPAFAAGTDLEAIAARANVVRLVTARDQGGNPTGYEGDKQLLDRYLAAFAAPSAGSEDAYIYQAATAWPERHDIAVRNHADGLGLVPGDVAVYLLAAAGGTIADEVLLAVARALGPKSARPLTDVVSVRRATIETYAVTAKLIIRKGASPLPVLEARRAAVQAFADSRYHIGGKVTVSGAISQLFDPNVVDVQVTTPVTDVPHGPDKAPYLTAITLTYEVET